MTGRRVVTCQLLRYSARLSGPGVLAACEATGVRHQYDRRGRAWLVPLTHADDVIGHLEHVQRRDVELVESVAS